MFTLTQSKYVAVTLQNIGCYYLFILSKVHLSCGVTNHVITGIIYLYRIDSLIYCGAAYDLVLLLLTNLNSVCYAIQYASKLEINTNTNTIRNTVDLVAFVIVLLLVSLIVLFAFGIMQEILVSDVQHECQLKLWFGIRVFVAMYSYTMIATCFVNITT